MQHLRSIKDPLEINQIKRACEVTEMGFRRILKFIKPDTWEYEIEAELLHEFISNRSKGFAYSPIIASGKNANILHYIKNNSQCKSGELVLIDSAAEYGNYLFTHAAVPLLQDHANSLTLEDLGEGLSDPSNAVDNIRLIEVNDAIRDHDVEIIGHELRGYMTDMKSIAESSNA